MTEPLLHIEPTGDNAADIAAAVRDAVVERGAVVVRDRGADRSRFESLATRLCRRFHHSGARSQLREAGDGYTTRTFDSNFTLLPHAEGAFRPSIDAALPDPVCGTPPELCFFHCLVAPTAEGGETAVVDGVAFLRAIDGSLRERLERTGLEYRMVWGPERWKAEFATDDPDRLDGILAGVAGVHHQFDGEELHLSYRTGAIRTTLGGLPSLAIAALAHLPRVAHPAFCEAYCRPTNRVFHGDGEELSDAAVGEMLDAMEPLVVRHRWCEGDTLVLDNARYLHGRFRAPVDSPRVLLSRFGWLGPTPSGLG